MVTRDQAVDKLMHTSHQELYEKCYYAHKEQYGIYGHVLSSYTRPELVNWYIVHYKWHYIKQQWISKLSPVNINIRNKILDAKEEQEMFEELGI